MAEAYGDYFLIIVGVIAAMSTFGALVVQVFPDVGTSGLIDLAAQFWQLNGNVITNGAAIASIVPVLAYGTNQALDELKNVQDSWKETEFAAFAVAFVLPAGYQVMGSTAAVGSPSVQAIMVGAYTVALAHIVDL